MPAQPVPRSYSEAGIQESQAETCGLSLPGFLASAGMTPPHATPHLHCDEVLVLVTSFKSW